MNENKRQENVAKDDSVVIRDNLIHGVFVDCDDIVEILNDKEASILHYEKRLKELRMEIAKLNGNESSARIINDENEQLKEENEQLKKDVEDLRQTLALMNGELEEMGDLND